MRKKIQDEIDRRVREILRDEYKSKSQPMKRIGLTVIKVQHINERW